MGIERLKSSWHSVDQVAVAICKIDHEPYSTHSGLIYRGDDGQLWLLHLAWNYDLRNDKHDKKYMCVIPKLRNERARSVAATCRLIWKKQKRFQQIPFSLKLSKDVHFDRITGDIVLSKGGHGLNCANFVIIVFLQNGIDLIDINTWKTREEDTERHTYLVAQLREQNARKSHIADVSAEIGCFRVRPEEVAGACFEDDRPVPFLTCEKNGHRVVNEINQRIKAAAERLKK